MAVVWLQLGVDVLRAICVILEVLEALAVRHIVSLKFDDRPIDSNDLVCGWDVNPMIHPDWL